MIKYLTPRSEQEIKEYLDSYKFCPEAERLFNFNTMSKESAIELDQTIRMLKEYGLWEKLDFTYRDGNFKVQ